jgi:hypothetical protein
MDSKISNKISSQLISKILISGSNKKVDEYLRIHKTISKHLFIVVHSQTQEKNSMTLETNDQFKTSIEFRACYKDTPCIIHISNLPVFYKNRVLSSISSSETTNMSLVLIPNEEIFW